MSGVAIPSPAFPANAAAGARAAALGDRVIAVEGLTKSFGGKRVVDNLSIDVRRGRVFGFLGPNGSGKTTTIRMLCGLLTPDAGRGTCLGYDILTQQREIKRHVGYMTQRFSLYEDLSIRENLDFVARVYGMDGRKARVDGALAQLGLEGRQRQLAGTLSGGWKQRLALAACILHEPELLLLDEPTAGVDPKARREFWDEIHRLAGEGLTVLVSTHYMDEAERCHEIAYIAYGHLMARGAVGEVVANSGLVTWSVEGADLHALAEALRRGGEVAMVAAFGTALHVSGTDAAALERATAPYREDPRWRWQRSEPSLEDVFIQLMARSEQP
jgi:ABC-2 type transport system ATP-binding protein